MIATPTYLRGWERVVEAYGYWPSFHDAKLRPFEDLKEGTSSIELVLHAWEMTRAVDERGYFEMIKHHLVRFRFEDLSDVALADLGKGSILERLELSPLAADGRFTVALHTVMELDGRLRARVGEVLDVTPCDGEGRVVEARARA